MNLVTEKVSDDYLMCTISTSLSYIKVPVIAIFTKFDGLVSTAYGELRDKEKFSRKEATNRKFERAQEKLKTNFIEPLQATAFGLSEFVRLDGKPACTNMSVLLL